MFYCFVDPQNITETEILITDENLYHLKNVRRVKIGEKIKIRSDRFVYIAIVQTISNHKIVAQIQTKNYVEKKRPNKILLATGLIQEKNFDLILQFGTQLGVDEFYPMITKNVSNKNVKPNKKNRWEKIIYSASIQSQRLDIPMIYEPCLFEDLLNRQKLIPYSKILPYELEKNNKMSQMNFNIQKNYLFFIGPEGGWTSEEIDLARTHQVSIVSLGDYILRTETASLVSITLLNSLLGYI